MPGTPASPQNRAYTLQPNAASVPSEMRVSIVAAPWRRLIHAARWNGQAPHSTTGPARAKASHCQYVNCSGVIIDMSSTGTPSTADPISRFRRLRTASSSVFVAAPGRRLAPCEAAVGQVAV